MVEDAIDMAMSLNNTDIIRDNLTDNGPDYKVLDGYVTETSHLGSSLNEVMKSVMRTSQGRRLIYMLLEQTGLFHTPLGPTDSITNSNVGKTDVGRFIYAAIDDACPELYPLMVSEFKNLARSK